MKKFKIISFVLILLTAGILLGAFSVYADNAKAPHANPSEDYLSSKYYADLCSVELTGDERTDVLLVALSQLGYHEGNSDADMAGANSSGSRNFVEYNRLHGKYDNGEGNGESYGYHWCCAFATWCMRAAGISEDVVINEISCFRLQSWLKSNSTYKARESGYQPKSGDLVFFKYPTNTITHHIGIVRYSDGARVYTIEGNSKTNDVALEDYEITDTFIMGYGVPAYKSNPPAAIDFTAFIPGTYYINTDKLNVRSGPGLSYDVLGGLAKGTKITVTEAEGKWGKVNYNGKTGWISFSYAYYVPSAVYTIYYDSNGGKGVVPAQPKDDGVPAYLTNAAPIKEGYALAGWSTDKDAKTAEYAPGSVFEVNADTTLYAVWVYGDCTVSFYNGDSLVSTSKYLNGSIMVPPTNVTKAGDKVYKYVFAGWDINSDGEADIAPGGTLTVTADTKCYAVFKQEFVEYKITFLGGSDGKKVLEEKTYKYGEEISSPAVKDFREEKFLYSFNGWSPEIAKVEGDASYVAQYTTSPAVYTVSFIDGDGRVVENGEYAYGDTVKLPEATPEKSADKTYTYTFDRWDKAAGAITDDTVFTALFKSEYIDYTVRFIDGDGNVYDTVTLHYGDEIKTEKEGVVKKSSDERNDYTFVSWNIPGTVEGDTDVTAKFDATARVYTVTFFNEDGTVYKTAAYAFGDSIVLPEPPEKAADAGGEYIFAGWTPASLLEGTVAGNINLTATFEHKATEDTDDPTGDDDKDISPMSIGIIISVVAIVLIAGGFVAFVTIRAKKRAEVEEEDEE